MTENILLKNNETIWKPYYTEHDFDWRVADSKVGVDISFENCEKGVCILSRKIALREASCYRITCEILIESNSFEKVSASIGVIYKTETGSWQGFSISDAVTEKGKWILVQKTFYGAEAFDTQFQVIVSGKCDHVTFRNCRLVEKSEKCLAVPKTIKTTLNIDKQKLLNSFTGFGAEMDPKFFSSFNLQFIKDPNKEWKIIEKRMVETHIQYVRTMLLPNIYEPQENKIDYYTDGCENLYRHLDLWERLGIRVNLTWWCIPRKDMPWQSCHDKPCWCSAPRDPLSAAKNLADFLHFLLKEKKYTCIRELILINEPNDAYLTDHGIDFDHYATFYRMVDTCLKENQIRDKIQLIGSDETRDFTWFEKCVDKLDDVLDGYSSHVYQWNFCEENLGRKIRSFVNERTSKTQKPFMIGEFGTESNAKWEMEVDQRALFLAAIAINALRAGATTISYWSLFDIYYGNGESQFMKTGLWKFVDQDWQIRPMGYVWKMICQSCQPGDSVWNTQCEVADAVYLQGNNHKSLLILNPNEDILELSWSDSRLNNMQFGQMFSANDESRGKVSVYQDFTANGCRIPPKTLVILSENS